MVKIRTTGLDGIKELFDKLEKPVEMAKKAVNAASPILEEALKVEIHAAVSEDATGELEGSIKAREAEENDLGVFAVVRPEGTDSKGVDNDQKLAWLEHGIWKDSRSTRGGEDRSGGKPQHLRGQNIRGRAIKRAEAECISTMEQVINKEVDKL